MTAEATGAQAKCDNCGGTLSWDPASGQLRCAACGAVRAVPPDGGTGAVIEEHDLAAELSGQKPRGRLGAGTRQVRCNECGAVVEFTEGVTASRCSFCDSPSVLAGEARADSITPESLIPFAVGRAAAVAAFKTWLGKLWFRPGDLRDKASVSELRGLYVPYWTFDCAVTSRWTGDAGYHYTVEETCHVTENGQQVTRHRHVQRTRWEPAHGERHDTYDDLLVCASKGLPGDLADRISAFNTADLVTYSTDYLQGYSAEAYAVEIRDAWRLAQERIARTQLRRCEHDVPGDVHRNVRATHQYADTRFKHVLLPVWLAAFRYRDQVYRFLVNGQSGEVAGKAPLSATKILLFVAILAAATVGAILLATR